MSIEQTLVAAGAKCVAGDLILKHDTLGHYRNGEFQPSLSGLALFEDLQKVKQEEILAVAREVVSTTEEQDRPRRGRRVKTEPSDYAVGGDIEVGDLK